MPLLESFYEEKVAKSEAPHHLPGREPTGEQKPKRSEKATKGPEDHPKISRRNTREREKGRSK